jgi:hypothetical protein
LEEANAISDISNYRNEASPFEQTLIVRVDSDVDNSCLGLGEHIVLRTINPQPNLDPQTLILCDDTNTGDMSELFDLTQNEAYILNGEADVVASYHTSIADAEAGENAIADPTAYANTNPTETIYVRVTNSITGCYARVEFDYSGGPAAGGHRADRSMWPVRTTRMVIFDFDLQSKTAEILKRPGPIDLSGELPPDPGRCRQSERSTDQAPIPISAIRRPIYVAITQHPDRL